MKVALKPEGVIGHRSNQRRKILEFLIIKKGGMDNEGLHWGEGKTVFLGGEGKAAQNFHNPNGSPVKVYKTKA